MAVQLKTLRAEIVPDLSKIAPGLAQADGLFDAFAKRTRAAPAVPIAPPDPRVASALETIATKANTAVGASDKVARALSTVGVQATRSERELLQYASAVARGQQATGNYAGAVQTLTTALGQVDSRSVQAVRATNQLTQAEEGAERQSRGLQGTLNNLQSAFGALGLAVGVQQLVAFGGEAIQAANQLDQTEATVRALSGSQERYNDVLKLAEAGQRKYGGSLADNLSGLGSLVNLSNRTSVELTQLDAVARRLAIVDPLQGVGGATVALKEFLTGSDATAIQSLVKRFELPKSALKELTDESISTADKLQRLDEILTDQGISMEVLTNRATTTAATYDRLGGSLDNAKVAFGKFLAEGLKPAAEGLDLVTRAALGNRDAIALLRAALSLGNDAAAERIKVAEEEVDALIQIGFRMTENQNAAAGGLFGGSEAFDQIKGTFGEVRAEAIRLSQANDESAEAVEKLLQAYSQTGNLDALQGQLSFLNQQQLAAARSADDAVPAYIRMAQAVDEPASAAQKTSAEIEKLERQLETTSERGSEATERLREAQARFADDTADRREQLARRLADAEQEGASRLADLTQQSAEQRSQLEADFGERRADAARDIATEIARIDEDLAETQASIVEQRTERLADIQARLVDAQEGLNQELTRQQQSYEDRLADLQTRSSDSRVDRQADAQQKLADLQAQLGQATDAEDQARIQRQIERANQDAAEKEARAARDEARALEKLERDRQRDEARAREKAAQQEAELQEQLVKEAAASAAKLAKAEQDAAADRQQAQAAAQARLSELDTQQAQELAKLDAKTASEREKIAAAQAEQLDDLRSAFAQDEQERAKAFARQETQLKEALGKQLGAYIDYQEQLGLIDSKTAQAKRTALAERFGVGEQQNANEFGALAAGLGTDGNVALAQRSLGLLGGLGNLPGLGALTSTVNAITVPQIIIQGVSDPEAAARMVRDEINRIARQNGSSGLS